MPEPNRFVGSDAGFAAVWPGCADFDPETLNDRPQALPCLIEQVQRWKLASWDITMPSITTLPCPGMKTRPDKYLPARLVGAFPLSAAMDRHD